MLPAKQMLVKEREGNATWAEDPGEMASVKRWEGTRGTILRDYFVLCCPSGIRVVAHSGRESRGTIAAQCRLEASKNLAPFGSQCGVNALSGSPLRLAMAFQSLSHQLPTENC